MILKQGHQGLFVPEIGFLHDVALVVGGSHYMLTLVRLREIDAMYKKNALLRGPPVCCAQMHMQARRKDSDSLQFYPIADKDYEIRIRYYPPLVEA